MASSGTPSELPQLAQLRCGFSPRHSRIERIDETRARARQNMPKQPIERQRLAHARRVRRRRQRLATRRLGAASAAAASVAIGCFASIAASMSLIVRSLLADDVAAFDLLVALEADRELLRDTRWACGRRTRCRR